MSIKRENNKKKKKERRVLGRQANAPSRLLQLTKFSRERKRSKETREMLRRQPRSFPPAAAADTIIEGD
eukprot:1162103-Pelagomonas_calceolata.AAC.9